MASVTYDRATRAFGSTVAVSELSLEIADGEFMVLVGPSGSGKTTALRLLAGLEPLTSGHVRIGERVVDDVAPRERDIAMVFQDYALYPQMSVRQNLAFGLRIRKLSRAEIDRRVERAAEMLGIGPLLERKPRQLSGGQRQRVALGRALVRDPQAFLMDEPLSNLDAQLRAQTRGEIKRLQREVGTTTVYVTHDQVEAMTMGDRIAVMRDGVLQQVGPPQELYEHPENMFVAGFIGSPAMNIVPAPLVGAGGDDRIVGFRPEHVRIDDPRSDGLQFDARVEVIEYLGNEKLVHAARNGTALTALVPVDQPVAEGEERVFTVSSAKLRLFDAEDGSAIRR
jgi:ABC-type sugar transport system ATPase subunit